MLRAVIFDFDGVLLDTETLEYTAWVEIFEEYGARLELADWIRFVGTWIPDDIYTMLAERTDRPVDRDSIRRRHRKILSQRLARAELCAGVTTLVSALQAADVRLAIASNSDRGWVHGHLDQRHFRAPFEVISTQEDVTRLKPEPDIYLLTLDRLGLKAHEAVVFEDSLPGATAALAAGLRVFVVPNPVTVQSDFPAGVTRIRSLADVSVAWLQAKVSR